jgi:GWxTD domain-containing protein
MLPGVVKLIRRWLSVLFASLVIAALAASPALSAKKDIDLEDWISGPIRYIALKQETEAFKRLDNDAARTLYIERFWQRRDPTPDTMVNEYRQLFWERVQQANENFVDSTKPGWMTDRGKIHILYGPPTEIQEDIHLQTNSSPSSGQGLIRWIYEGRPGDRMDLDAVVVVAFARDAGGEYRVSYDPKLTSVFFDANAIREGVDKYIDTFLEHMNAHSTSPLSVMLDLGRMQEVPPQEQVLLERVETMEAYDSYEVHVAVDRYLHPQRKQTVAALTVDLSDSAPGEKPTIVARLTPLDATKPPRLLGEDSFRLLEHEDARVAQARITLDPGSYNLTLMVADAIKVRTGMFRGSLTAQPDSDRLRFSDIIWASDLEPLPYASLASHDEPFHVGPFQVVPKFDSIYRPGDAVKLFYEVYSAEFPLRVSYSLQGKEDSGTWVNLGRPSVGEQNGSSQGWELQTGENWPTGEYRLLIEVQDAEGRMISATKPFMLETE